MNMKRVSAVVAIGLLTTSCSSRVRAPSAGAQGTAGIGWVIMVGTVGRSRSGIRVPVGSAQRVRVTGQSARRAGVQPGVLLFLPHDERDEYTGSIQIGFFEGASPHEIKPNITVKSGGPVANTSVLGIVSRCAVRVS